MKQYKHVGNMKVYCYRWYLATEDGSRLMIYTSKPKVKGAKSRRIKNARAPFYYYGAFLVGYRF